MDPIRVTRNHSKILGLRVTEVSMALNRLQEEGLRRFLHFINAPLPTNNENWRQLEKEVIGLYRKIDPFAPPLPRGGLRKWIPRVQQQARTFVQRCVIGAQQTNQKTR